MKPYFHTLKVLIKNLKDGSIKELNLSRSMFSYTFDSDSNCQLVIQKLMIPPQSQVSISVSVRKLLLPFEDYSNDPSRGFNIPHMPIFYKID